MYIITTRRITSGELLKQRKGFCIRRGYGPPLPVSSRFSLTRPAQGFPRQVAAQVFDDTDQDVAQARLAARQNGEPEADSRS